jgi:hypothetical protein
MINLQVAQENQFAIYADTISSDVQTFGDYFLIGFRSLYTNHWSYVAPTVVSRNSRFVRFNITVVERGTADDPLNGLLAVFPPGNYSYKIWNLENPSLDPSTGIAIDEGQMIMAAYTPPEINEIVYVSDNENFQNEIYYSGIFNNCIIDYTNSPYIIEIDTTNTCQPLEIANTGYLLIKKGLTLTLTS